MVESVVFVVDRALGNPYIEAKGNQGQHFLFIANYIAQYGNFELIFSKMLDHFLKIKPFENFPLYYSCLLAKCLVTCITFCIILNVYSLMTAHMLILFYLAVQVTTVSLDQ